MRTSRARLRGAAIALGVPACLALALAPAARAGVGASAAPSFPAAVTVGEAGLAATIEVRNADTDANAADANIVCNFGDPLPCPAGDQGIALIPACGQLGAFSTCTGAEPGVFRISDVATGVAGTACAGMVFTVSLANPADGRVRFTPQGGAHVALPGAGSLCRIGFTFSVLRVPSLDQNPGAPGIQTVQVSDDTQADGVLTASARGSSFGTTVSRSTPAIATTASPGVTLGGQLTDTAVVSGRVSPVAGATVDFRLYGPDDPTCAKAPVFESLGRLLDASGAAASTPFVPQAPGVYRWRAFYSGDANNEPVTGACDAAGESATVIGPPTITVRTEQSSGPCRVTRFSVHVEVAAAGLRGVRVTLDGRTIKRSKRASFTLKVRARGLRSGRHVLRVIATGAGGRSTRTTTFKRCRAPSLPRFVG